MEPPRAATPFTVVKSLAVSTSQITLPSTVEYARKWPSTEPEKTAPGTAAAGAESAGLHDVPGVPAGLLPHALPFAVQATFPSAGLIAYRPPPADESSPRPTPVNPMSESGAKNLVPSLADPHSSPPSALPWPTGFVQSFFPFASGSNACTSPDFWPASSTRLPPGSDSRIGDCSKS